MKINILALDGVFDTGLATLLDTFAAANDMARRQSMNISRFDVQMIAMTGQVKSAHGLSIPAHQASGLIIPTGLWCRRSTFTHDNRHRMAGTKLLPLSGFAKHGEARR